MPRRLIVLKLGGSVLRDVEALEAAASEISRWRRRGWNVLAVPSALGGVTDARTALARRLSPDASPHAVASLLATGEFESAASLSLVLDRHAIEAAILLPHAINLRASGHPLDATPIALATGVVRRAIESAGVVVIPGFVACDGAGRTVTLGRGGSDLTALFLAQHLRADRCRLIKDVDGLYEWDPGAPGPRPRRYQRATWADALALDGSILQHKAIDFARRHTLTFEVGSVGHESATRVGPDPAVLEPIDLPAHEVASCPA